jgi:hypothetical protein
MVLLIGYIIFPDKSTTFLGNGMFFIHPPSMDYLKRQFELHPAMLALSESCCAEFFVKKILKIKGEVSVRK